MQASTRVQATKLNGQNVIYACSSSWYLHCRCLWFYAYTVGAWGLNYLLCYSDCLHLHVRRLIPSIVTLCGTIISMHCFISMNLFDIRKYIRKRWIISDNTRLNINDPSLLWKHVKTYCWTFMIWELISMTKTVSAVCIFWI